MTPLHWASFHNLDRNVLLLLDKGADPSVLDHESKSPLSFMGNYKKPL
ncbi:MAG: ankyrin repeat domain-containing protein [Gammaproteobacteria bacterium]|nr:ankyrin repeat domain-containing protein [Gammaproteobacteria bacterium]